MFVENLESNATHLTKLTQKEVCFKCPDKCEESFQNLKDLLNTTSILTFLVEGKDFIVYFDASNLGFGVVLM